MLYDLTKPEDRASLMVDVIGLFDDRYLHMREAQMAFEKAIAAGYVLTPPVDQKTREDMADCLSGILSDIGGWLEDDELTRNVYELIAIARGNTPQPANIPCTPPPDTVTVRLIWNGRILEMGGFMTMRVGKVFLVPRIGWKADPFDWNFPNSDVYGPYDTEAEARAALMAAAKEALGG